MANKRFDVVALGELLIDFTGNGLSGQGNTLFEANPGGTPCNVLAMLKKRARCDILKIADNELEFMTGETDFDRGRPFSGKNALTSVC